MIKQPKTVNKRDIHVKGQTMPKGWQTRVITLWRGWGYSIFIALLVATSFKSAIADWNDVPTGSMIPTILIGDRIFVNKLAYDLKVPYTTWHLKTWSEPQRGDIVVFYSPKNGQRLVKRVIGVPGDTVAMLKNRLYINGRFLAYQERDQKNYRCPMMISKISICFMMKT